MLKIPKKKFSPLKISIDKKSVANNGKNELIEINKPHEEISRKGFQEGFNIIITATYLYENKYYIKRLGYFQGKTLNRIIKNPKIVFLISLIADIMFFFMLLLHFNFKSLNLIIETSFNVIIIVYFLFFMGHLPKLLFYSAYKRDLSIHYLIFFQLLDLITEVLLLSILAFSIPNNTSQIYVILCLIVQLCHATNVLNQRRKIIEPKTYLSRTFFIIINMFALIGILYNYFIQNIYFLIGSALFLSFFLIRNVYRTNTLLSQIN
jgi:hypothetical protein